MSQPDVHHRLPLSETTFLVLLSLAPEPKTGYAILKDVETLSEGRAPAGGPAFQAELDRLLAEGWIEPTADATQRGYTLAALGRSVLNAEIARLRAMVHAARQATPGDKPSIKES